MSKEKHISDGGSTSYYDLPVDAKDLQDLVEHKNMNFSIGNIFKACYRMGEKSGQDDLYDLNKIIFFAGREIDRLKKINKKDSNEEPIEDEWLDNPFKNDIISAMVMPDNLIIGDKVDVMFKDGYTQFNGLATNYSWGECARWTIMKYRLVK